MTTLNFDLGIYKKIFELTRYSIHPEKSLDSFIDISCIKGINDEIFKVATVHGLLPFVADAIVQLSKKEQIPVELKINCSLLLEKREKRYDKIVEIVKEIGEKLKEEDTDILVLKGLGISLMYNKPYLRDFCDLDCYLLGKYEVLNDLLEKEGIKVIKKKQKHSNSVYKGLSIENHRKLLYTDIYDIDKRIHPLLISLANDAEKNKISLFKNDILHNNMYVPTPTFNALFLLRHSMNHFIAGNMPFRHISDWCVFLKSTYNSLDKEKIKKLFKEFDMENIAGAFCYLSVEYFGLDSKYSIYSNIEKYKNLGEQILITNIESNLLFKKKSPGGFKHILFKWNRLKHQSKPYKVIYGNGFWIKKAKRSIISYVKFPAKFLSE